MIATGTLYVSDEQAKVVRFVDHTGHSPSVIPLDMPYTNDATAIADFKALSVYGAYNITVQHE